MISYFVVPNDVHQLKAINESLTSQNLTSNNVVSIETVNGNLVKVWVSNIPPERVIPPTKQEYRVEPASNPPSATIEVDTGRKTPIVTNTVVGELLEGITPSTSYDLPMVDNSQLSKAELLNQTLAKQSDFATIIEPVDDLSVGVTTEGSKSISENTQSTPNNTNKYGKKR